MRLEEYWGVGPKTSALLREALGTERAVEAIESADLRTLADAGLGRGRATRILRRATGTGGMDLLATGDARSVYRDLLARASEHALTERAADRIRVLTPLTAREQMTERLDRIEAAREAWTGLDEATRDAVREAYEGYDSRGGERAAVETARALAATDAEVGVFEPVAALDADALGAAADALGALDGDVRGADEELDALTAQYEAAERLAADASEVLSAVQSGARTTAEFEEAFVDYLDRETGVPLSAVREAMADDAVDAEAFVRETLRSLAADRRQAMEAREAAVREDLSAAVETHRETIEAAVRAVDDAAFYLSLARFAEAFDATRPTLVDRRAVAVRGARNLALAAEGSVQPVDYAVGPHGLDLPTERVSVLTGANSGGKTTLLETVCAVVVLSHMGLPVPAEEAVVGTVDSVVFHRRHASFNAGVLESTLRTVVPPLASEGRTLMLVDEFEAITEPGSAADLLHGLVTLTVDRVAMGTFVTHLAEDLEPLPDDARVDGIFAEGLTPDLELAVDYQPRFHELGRSTPEFIVSRLVADARDRAERAGFQTLAEAVGQEAVQRTLSDARWSPD
ncbi:MAG: DNA mismatch repair protein [Haloarculaceae archaeon]